MITVEVGDLVIPLWSGILTNKVHIFKVLAILSTDIITMRVHPAYFDDYRPNQYNFFEEDVRIVNLTPLELAVYGIDE